MFISAKQIMCDVAHYLVRAKYVWGALKQLRRVIDQGEVVSMQPFGRALDHSLRNARYDPSSGSAVWIEEDYCSPPLAMERKAVLDQYFYIDEVVSVNPAEGWKTIAHFPSLWTPLLGLPQRKGERPLTRRCMPHQQLTQNPPARVYKTLADRIFSLPGVRDDVSIVSVPGARALVLEPSLALGPPTAFIFNSTEFAHLHPPYDSSLHLSLPEPWAAEVTVKGWGEPHPLAGKLVADNYLMVYAPRNEEEVETIYEIVLLSYWWARGHPVPHNPS
jgi:hypothetical protein